MRSMLLMSLLVRLFILSYDGMFRDSGLRLSGECRLSPFILGEIDVGESDDKHNGFPVADTGDVDVAIVVFVEGSE